MSSMVDMKLNIKFSANVTGSCRLLFQLTNSGLYLQNSNYLSGNTNLHFEILNHSKFLKLFLICLSCRMKFTTLKTWLPFLQKQQT